MSVSAQALRLLDLIEAIEMQSLEWGFTDGALSEDETLALAHCVNSGDVPTATADDLVDELIEGRLIFELQSVDTGVRVRSRFAEMMRLLVANRQLFANRPWQGAPHLVSDFRVDRRPRRFPRRERLPSDVLAEHSSVVAPSELKRDLWQALTSRPGMKLASFQERAVLRLSKSTGDAGTIVTAGTGSGKTIAFYLPCMLRIGEAIGVDSWVKAIAIYPRTELLKDQFAEAFRMARAIDAPLAKHGRRPLRIGALFGATPTVATRDELVRKKWPQRGRDFVCPWMRCQFCDAELLWRQADVESETERLFCAKQSCAGLVAEGHIALTRTRLQREPPDILFTTTEMLNQRLSDHRMCGLFGVGIAPAKRPFLALLDEVHTYAGASGAQAALTLRRWRHLLAAPVGWVGLSATLQDAARFFADLCGSDIGCVVEITPDPDEFEAQGAEYQVLLRGDPASRASLLSTTIQTAMLVSRVLDPPGDREASGTFGRRVFLFTDDLDATNRLYDGLRDAEAYTIFGRPDPQREPLANIRRAGADSAVRDVEGQRWRICELIGHPLNRPLVVGRTSSQDAGVNDLANVVVATASLEVGFNDPMVGAVIQHKAPRGMASFLQRKGRAGRDRVMRPITLTVLSDYGRDRAFYQGYEHLFDATVEPQYLPIRNPYVLKIQAVFALFDWLSARTAGTGRAWQWDLLSKPRAKGRAADVKATMEKLKAIVKGEAAAIDDLRSYLASALGIDALTVDTLLWEAPRSLLLEAVPTLVRRLHTDWRLAFPATGGALDFQVDYHPLPDFVPRTLFSDLSLPDVRVILPPATSNHEERIEVMPILQALTQLVPGRVTRRFAHERGGLSHWVAVDPLIPEQALRISDYAEEHEFVGTFTGRLNDHVDREPLLVFRPWTVRLSVAARSDALPSSNARLSWRTDIVANGEPLEVPVPTRSEWGSHVRKVEFYLHRFRSSANVRRFAPVANADIRTLQNDFRVALRFTSDDDRPAALGFELEVDGFRVDLSLPDAQVLAAKFLPPSVLAASRTAYLRDSFQHDSGLPAHLNSFQRDWLFQFLVCAVLTEMATAGRSLEDVASDLLSDERLEDVFHRVMEEYFGDLPPAYQDDQDAADDSHADDDSDAEVNLQGDANGGGAVPSHRGPSRLQQALAVHLANPIVRERLRALASQFRQPDIDSFNAWQRRLTLETLGEAMLQACIASAPRQATVDTLLVDIHDDATTGQASVWITESNVGGAGVLQSFAERFAAEPRSFFAALEAALAPTDLELVDRSLRAVLELADSDSIVADDIAMLRKSTSHGSRGALWQSFTKRVASRGGIDLSHAFSVSLNTRLLRAGSGPKLDQLLLNLLSHWDRIEQQFGVSIALREFAYICSKDVHLAAAVRSFLATTLPAYAVAHVTVLAAITSLLWPRSDEVRHRALRSYNPYRQTRTTDPAVVRHLLLNRSITTINLEEPDWPKRLSAAFETHGTCRLSALAADSAALRLAIVQLVASPVDIGVLQFFPVVERVERVEERMLANFTLREQA